MKKVYCPTCEEEVIPMPQIGPDGIFRACPKCGEILSTEDDIA
jgi:hypothetical protein